MVKIPINKSQKTNDTECRNHKHFFSCFALACLSLCFVSIPSISAQTARTVHVIELSDDTINPVTADYIAGAIDRARRDGVECLIIKLDTPGGLLSSTRLIVKKMLTSPVPVVVYIAPSGSHAGSAGVFITYASHVAAMAPSTNIGAAHPVQMGAPGEMPRKPEEWNELRELIKELKEDRSAKEKIDSSKNKAPDHPTKEEDVRSDEDPMSSKILQDTSAFIRAIALKRGRSAEWAVESVTKSSSITDQEALAKGVVEIIADDEQDLLEKLDGRVVETAAGPVTLKTKDAILETVGMDARQRFFNVLANPNIAYILLILGFYGLLFEITHPGFGMPGILGMIFLILGFYSMQMLPTNYAGLALLVVGLGLLVMEAFTPAFGLLTLGGVVCLVLGSMLLFESVDPFMRVSLSAISAVTLTTVGITLFLLRSVVRAHRSKVLGGKEGLIGETGVSETPISSRQPGRVFVHGEGWNAVSDEDIKKDEEVIVVEVRGLTVKVEQKSPS